MYRAKEAGRSRCEVFSPLMRVRAIAREETETELQGAAERGELRVHYQPMYSTADRRLSGWRRWCAGSGPDHGLVPPNEFIPVAEDSGLIVTLGDWVLGEATRQLAAWRTRSRSRPS